MKAVLVMEMPENCVGCPLFSGSHSDMTCCGSYRTIDFPYPDDKVQDWCPLIPMPEKKDYEKLSDGNPTKAWGNGWNACLDAIEGSKG